MKKPAAKPVKSSPLKVTKLKAPRPLRKRAKYA